MRSHRTPPGSTPTGRLHPPRETAGILTISVRTLQALTAAGKISPVRVSARRLAYSDAEIARYLAAQAR